MSDFQSANYEILKLYKIGGSKINLEHFPYLKSLLPK